MFRAKPAFAPLQSFPYLLRILGSQESRFLDRIFVYKRPFQPFPPLWLMASPPRSPIRCLGSQHDQTTKMHAQGETSK